MADIWWLLIAGLGAGFVSGLLGVGGGIVMVPVLHYFLGVSFAEATALSLFVIMVQAPIGILRHHQKNAVDWRIGGWLIVGGFPGVVVGIWLQPQIAVPWLKVLFAVVMLWAAYRLLRKPEAPTHDRRSRMVYVYVGFLAGILSRLLGIGGGILTVPVLVLLGVAPHVAVASSLLPVWTNATVASIWSLIMGLEWQVAIPLSIAALAGAPLGVATAHALPAGKLKLTVATAMVVVAVLIAATSGI